MSVSSRLSAPGKLDYLARVQLSELALIASRPPAAHPERRRRPGAGQTSGISTKCLRIRGKLHYLWRAADQNGHVLDILVQSERSAKAAKRFLGKLLKDLQDVPA
jgi:transposase-like protein